MSGKKSAISGSLFIAGTGLGFLNYLLITRRYGIGGVTDAYFLCHSLGELLIRLLLCQEFQPAYLARYHEARGAGRGGASLSATLILLLLLLGPLTLAGIWGAPALVASLAPGLAADAAGLTAALLRWNLLAMLLQYLTQPLIAACYHEGESWVEPGSLLLLTAGVTAAIIAPAGTLALAVQVHVAGFAAMALLALWRLHRAGAGIGAPRRGDFAEAAGFLRSLLPLGSMVITRSLFRWGYTALLSGLPAGTITLVNFGEKIFGAGVALVSQGYARIALPGLLKAGGDRRARRCFLVSGAYLSAILAAALLGASASIPPLAFPHHDPAQLALCAGLLRAFAATVLFGGVWECVRMLGLTLRLNRPVTLSGNGAHLISLAVMLAAWRWIGGAAATPPALPLYYALACLLAALFLFPRLLAGGDGVPAGEPAGNPARGLDWALLALPPLTGLLLPGIIPGPAAFRSAATLLLISSLAGLLLWRELRRSAPAAR